jgi:hypothetical protein
MRLAYLLREHVENLRGISTRHVDELIRVQNAANHTVVVQNSHSVLNA